MISFIRGGGVPVPVPLPVPTLGPSLDVIANVSLAWMILFIRGGGSSSSSSTSSSNSGSESGRDCQRQFSVDDYFLYGGVEFQFQFHFQFQWGTLWFSATKLPQTMDQA